MWLNYHTPPARDKRTVVTGAITLTCLTSAGVFFGWARYKGTVLYPSDAGIVILVLSLMAFGAAVCGVVISRARQRRLFVCATLCSISLLALGILVATFQVSVRWKHRIVYFGNAFKYHSIQPSTAPQTEAGATKLGE